MIPRHFFACFPACLTIAALAGFFFISSAAAETKGQNLTLKEAVLLAMRHNPTIINSEIQRVVDKFALAVAKDKFDFQYNLTGSTEYSSTVSAGAGPSHSYNAILSPATSITTGIGTKYALTWTNSASKSDTTTPSYNPQISLTITQPLLRGSGSQIVKANLNKAILTELASRFAFKNTIINQINTVVTNYRQVVKNQHNVSIQKQALNNDKRTVWEYQQKIKAGQMAPANIFEVQKTVFQDKLNLATAENTLHTSMQTLLLSLGLSPYAKLTLDDTVTIDTNRIPELKSSIKLGLAQNPDYQTALINLAQSKISLAENLDSARWQLDFTANAKLGGTAGTGSDAGLTSLTNGRNHSHSLALNLTVPIHDLSLEQNKLSARTALEKTTLDLQQKKYQLESTISEQITTLHSDLAQIELAKQALAFAKRSYHITQKKIAVGQSTTFELTSKSTELTRSEETLLNEKMTFLNDFAKLDATLGNTLNRWHLQLPG